MVSIPSSHGRKALVTTLKCSGLQTFFFLNYFLKDSILFFFARIYILPVINMPECSQLDVNYKALFLDILAIQMYNKSQIINRFIVSIESLKLNACKLPI